ncbi:MAG: hypothetical protein IJ758_02020 [Clostridia bacterium]|nr:hypothetical protein [Clostridia bacterium]
MTSKYVDMMIEKYGESVTIQAPDMVSQTTKAIIQPLRKKGGSYYADAGSDLGIIDDSCFLYIGKKDVRLDLYPFGTTVIAESEKYVLKKAHKVNVGENIVHIWGIIQRYNGEDG